MSALAENATLTMPTGAVVAHVIEGESRQEREFLNADGSPATWEEPLTEKQRQARAAWPVVIGLALACVVWAAQYANGTLLTHGVAGLVVVGVGVFVAYLRYQVLTERKYSKAPNIAENRERRYKVAKKWVITAGVLEAFAVVFFFMSNTSTAQGWPALAIPFAFLVPAGWALSGRGEASLTPAAAEAIKYYEKKAEEDARRKSAGDDFFDRLLRPWWVRYPLAVAVGYAGMLLFENPKVTGWRAVVYGLGLLVIIGALAREAAIVVLVMAVVGGGGYLVFSGIAALC